MNCANYVRGKATGRGRGQNLPRNTTGNEFVMVRRVESHPTQGRSSCGGRESEVTKLTAQVGESHDAFESRRKKYIRDTGSYIRGRKALQKKNDELKGNIADLSTQVDKGKDAPAKGNWPLNYSEFQAKQKFEADMDACTAINICWFLRRMESDALSLEDFRLILQVNARRHQLENDLEQLVAKPDSDEAKLLRTRVDRDLT
ncbi:transposase IS3/IS911 [Striga asiatica]|uniref:Transposase IS3/IS911 n=1 Tax=Striga asiatica TaxID=4170 RepID=A0A5A7NXU9_STRAF|nr:transposase IS3/IS911 [Striga asiatica]